MLLLEAVIFQELYRQDLLDTTFYANDGFLTGRHATEEDPKTRDRILALADESHPRSRLAAEQEPQRRGRPLCARLGSGSQVYLHRHGRARLYGAGFRLATEAKDDGVRVLQIDPNYVDAKLVVGVYEYVVGALPFPFKFLIGFAGITGSKTRGLEMLTDDGKRGVDDQRRSAHCDRALPAPGVEV